MREGWRNKGQGSEDVLKVEKVVEKIEKKKKRREMDRKEKKHELLTADCNHPNAFIVPDK